MKKRDCFAPAGLAMTACLIALLLVGCARARVVRNRPEKPAAPVAVDGAVSATVTPSKIGPVVAPHLPASEHLEYQISWWGVPVALLTLDSNPVTDKADMEKLSKDGFHPENLLKLDCQARTNTYLEAFFPIRVRLVSFLDPETRTPRRFEAFVRRRFHKHESVEIFHPEEGKSFHQLPKGRSVTVPIGPDTQDGLSLLYFVRTLPFQMGQEIPMEVSADGQNWPLKGKIVQTGTIQIKEMKSWPVFAGEGELAYPLPFFRGARALLWLSADEERIPLLAKVNSHIGPVTLVLTRRTTAGSPSPLTKNNK